MDAPQKTGDSLDLDKLTLAQWWRILRLTHVKAAIGTLVAVVGATTAAAFWMGKSAQEVEQQRLIANLEKQLVAERENTRVAEESQRNALKEAQAKTQTLIDEMQGRSREGLPITAAPSTWDRFRGIKNLPGTWRGTVQDESFVVDIQPPHGEQMLAKFRSSSTNCQATLKLVRATDDQLTTSNFFFKPTVATPTCPDIESIMFRPFETFSDFRLVTTKGRSVETKLVRKV